MGARIQIKGKADQVVDCIAGRLKSGSFKAGDKLPSERELARELGVSLLTVNKAMSRLEDAGLVRRSSGRGTHVVKLPSADAVAVIFDMCHLADSAHSPFIDTLLEKLMETAASEDLAAHFLIGKGKTAQEFLSSLSFQSNIWNTMKGAVAMGWRAGVEEALAERGIPLVTISSKDQGRNAVTIDYEKLGRLAAGIFLENPARGVTIVHNTWFSDADWNNPVKTFLAELRKKQYDLAHVQLMPADATQAAGFALGARLGGGRQDLFFTDENIAAGFAAWMSANPGPGNAVPGRRIITQSSGCDGLAIPESFERLEFKVATICREAFRLLRNITTVSPPTRIRVKPVRIV